MIDFKTFLYLPLLALTLTACTFGPKRPEPPPVEVVDVGTCKGGMCVWKTPAGSTVIVVRDNGLVLGGGTKPSQPGKVTLGTDGPNGGGMHFENFTILDKPR